jgi:hypothetical protein
VILGATFITALLAGVGRSRPGTFLKVSAWLSVVGIADVGLRGYANGEINRAVFKMDNVEPKPGKLWERTKHWTTDDVVISGGVAGAFLALNPKAFPGVGGWKRFLGAATAGCAVGSFTAPTILRTPPGLSWTTTWRTETQIRTLHYDRLKQDEKAQETLSRSGKWITAFYTLPGLRRSSGIADGGFSTTGDPRATSGQQDTKDHTLVLVEFNNGELNGPDLEEGIRVYRDRLADRDSKVLQEWLEHLQELWKANSSEARYTRLHLATKEREFYNLQADEKETDIARRELQMLNTLAFSFTLRDVIYAYHIADVQKRLDQMDQKDVPVQDPMLDLPSMRPELPKDWTNRHSPQLAMEQVRLTWTKQKEIVGICEETLALQTQPGTEHDAHFKQVREAMGIMKLNVAATERLLKEYEEKLRRADEYVEKSKKPVDE